MSLKNSLLKELKSRRDELNKEIIKLSKEKDIKRIEKDKLSRDLDELTSKISNSKDELSYLDKEIASRKELIAHLEYKIRQNEEKLRELDVSLESNISLLDNINSKIKNLDDPKIYEVELEDKSRVLLSKRDILMSQYLEEFNINDIKEISYDYSLDPTIILKLADVSREELRIWIEKGQIPKGIYKSMAQDLKPLPKILYIDPRTGNAWAQIHIRGITPEEYKDFRNGKKKLWEILIGQSFHVDLRIKYPGLEKLVQFVLTENDIQSLIKTLRGERTKTASGILNVHHSKVVSKPSGEPPEKDKFYKAKEDKKKPSIDEEGAKLMDSLFIKDKSYWIEPNNIGSTKYTYAYMGLIWMGEVVTGCERHDLHELFIHKKLAKDDILDGKFTIKCLKDKAGAKRWEIWKAIKNPKPLDPILHGDIGYHYLVPAEKVDKLGKESYREVSKKLYLKKLK